MVAPRRPAAVNYANGGVDWIEDDENNGEPILANACDGVHHPAKGGLLPRRHTIARAARLSCLPRREGRGRVYAAGSGPSRGRAGEQVVIHCTNDPHCGIVAPCTTSEVGCLRAAAGLQGEVKARSTSWTAQRRALNTTQSGTRH